MKKRSFWLIIMQWRLRFFVPYVLLIVLLVLGICTFFKYVFLETCIGQTCPDKVVDLTGPLVGVSGIVFTALALVPIFLVESKVKAAKEEVSREIIGTIQGEIIRLVDARVLLAQVHREQQPGQLLADEQVVQQAVSLWPSVKKQEYPWLGKRFALTALDLNAGFQSKQTLGDLRGGDALFPSPTLYPSATLYPMDLKTAVQKAIFYLEDSLEDADMVDRDLLFALTCMYGFSVASYEEMIRCLERAIRFDDNVKDDFARCQSLAMLARSCNRERRKLERIGAKVGVELPMSEAQFVQVVQATEPSERQTYIEGYLINKQPDPANRDPLYRLKFLLSESNGKLSITSANYYQQREHAPNQPLRKFVEDGEAPIDLTTFFKRIEQKFYLIALKIE